MTPANGNMISALTGMAISLVAARNDWAGTRRRTRSAVQGESGEALTRLRSRTANIARQQCIHTSSRAIPSDAAAAVALDVRGFVTEFQKNKSPSANGALPAQWQIQTPAGAWRSR